MALPKTTQDRIMSDALKLFPFSSHQVNGVLWGDTNEYARELWIAGATAEATNAESIRLQLEAQDANVEILLQQKKELTERAQKLAEALNKIKDLCEHEDYGNKAENCPACLASTALQQWNAGKEVEG